MPAAKPFRERFSLEKRKGEAQKVLGKYTDRVPVIVERGRGGNDIGEIDKCKYLVPRDLTVGQFQYIIRKRIKLDPKEALFVFVNNQLPPATALMSQVYKQHQAEDGFLYVQYSGESAFGAR